MVSERNGGAPGTAFADSSGVVKLGEIESAQLQPRKRAKLCELSRLQEPRAPEGVFAGCIMPCHVCDQNYLAFFTGKKNLARFPRVYIMVPCRGSPYRQFWIQIRKSRDGISPRYETGLPGVVASRFRRVMYTQRAPQRGRRIFTFMSICLVMFGATRHCSHPY